MIPLRLLVSPHLISLDLNETNAISPPCPFLGERVSGGEGSSSDLYVSGSVICLFL